MALPLGEVEVHDAHGAPATLTHAGGGGWKGTRMDLEHGSSNGACYKRCCLGKENKANLVVFLSLY